jgi:hypothetical protein
MNHPCKYEYNMNKCSLSVQTGGKYTNQYASNANDPSPVVDLKLLSMVLACKDIWVEQIFDFRRGVPQLLGNGVQ